MAKVRVSSSGNAVAELLDRVTIAPQAGGARAVAMRLGAGGDPDESLPDLRPGDMLQVSAELEVTTDLTPQQLADNNGKGCASHAYDYSPDLRALLLLTTDPAATRPSANVALRIGDPTDVTVTHDQHHWVVVFDRARLEVPAGWPGQGTVNLVLDASNAGADPLDCLLVGQNEQDGSVERDMAMISACRIRPANFSMPAWTRATTTLRSQGLRVRKNENDWRVIYSTPLTGLNKNEQVRVHANVVANAKPLGIPARLTTRVFLADSPGQTEPDAGPASQLASAKGRVSKPNGSNCLPAGGPHVAEKVGAFRVLQNQSAGSTVHLNVVGQGGDPTKRAQAGAELSLKPQGFLDVQRIPAGRFG